MMLEDEKEREAKKKERLDTLTKIPKETRDKETAVFKEAIEQGSSKGFDRTEFFFDEPLRSIKRDTMDEQALAKAKEAADLLKEYQALDDELKDDDLIKELSASITQAEKDAKDAQAKLKKQRTDSAPDPEITKALLASSGASTQAIQKLRAKLKSPKTPESGDQYQRLMKTFEEIIRRAYEIRDVGGSVADVEKAMEHVPPEFWPAQFELHKLLLEAGDAEGAARALEKTVALNPDYAPAYYGLAQIYASLGNRDAARKAREKHHALATKQREAAEQRREEAPSLPYTIADR